MPIVQEALTELIKTKIDANMASFGKYGGPLSQQNPAYFIAMCQGIAQGIAQGTKTINFTTKDIGMAATPLISGVGSGVGILVDADFLDESIYTNLRNSVIADFGSTLHEPFPPSSQNSGNYLRAFSSGIAFSIKEHLSTAMILTSTHTTIYAGKGDILNGSFYGLDASAIKNFIVTASPTMQGSFWSKVAEAISLAYVDSIHNHSTSSVVISGICVPSANQVCGLPLVGAGTGTAS